MKNLFDLDIFSESKKDDDLLNMTIESMNESTEDHLLDMVLEDVSIPVPGGDKESPGTSEMEISEDEYNDALDNLKKSFKESYEVLEMLEKAIII